MLDTIASLNEYAREAGITEVSIAWFFVPREISRVSVHSPAS